MEPTSEGLSPFQKDYYITHISCRRRKRLLDRITTSISSLFFPVVTKLFPRSQYFSYHVSASGFHSTHQYANKSFFRQSLLAYFNPLEPPSPYIPSKSSTHPHSIIFPNSCRALTFCSQGPTLFLHFNRSISVKPVDFKIDFLARPTLLRHSSLNDLVAEFLCHAISITNNLSSRCLSKICI